MVRAGYSLIRTSDGAEIQSWSANTAPPEFINIKEALISVACPKPGWSYGGYTLVERWLDVPSETRDQKLSPMVVTFKGNQATITRALVDRTPEELAAYDASLVPFSITRRQARLALLAAGKLDAVEAMISAADRSTQIWYQDAATWERSHPMLNALAAGLKLTNTDVDSLFIQAAAL